MSFRIYKVTTYDELSRKAASILAAQITIKPDSVLGLATGSTPIGAYHQLAKWYKENDLDFSEVSSVNLDEYRGLAKENEQSYYYFMHENLFDLVNIDPSKTFLPDGTAQNPEKACRKYDQTILELGGVDLQLLGIGHDGHIGFNEPGESFVNDTHLVDLDERTIRANSRFFSSEDEVPRQAYTVGIRTIMNARRILMVAFGSEKAGILKEAFFGEITPKVPASILQLHQDVTLVADEAALSKWEQG